MQISHRKEFLELTFRALALRQGRRKKELTKLKKPLRIVERLFVRIKRLQLYSRIN